MRRSLALVSLAALSLLLGACTNEANGPSPATPGPAYPAGLSDARAASPAAHRDPVQAPQKETNDFPAHFSREREITMCARCSR